MENGCVQCVSSYLQISAVSMHNDAWKVRILEMGTLRIHNGNVNDPLLYTIEECFGKSPLLGLVCLFFIVSRFGAHFTNFGRGEFKISLKLSSFFVSIFVRVCVCVRECEWEISIGLIERGKTVGGKYQQKYNIKGIAKKCFFY